MATVSIKITPADHGRRMTLADFEHAEVQEGKRYELGRGVVVVADVPNPPHLGMVTAVKFPLIGYAMTKQLWEHLSALSAAHVAAKDIKPELALSGMPVPLHPGAERYYREHGALS